MDIDNIQSDLQDVDEVTKKVKVSIPAEFVEREFASALAELAGSVNLKGFRKGKAPRQMVEKLHGSRVRMEVANRLVSSSLQSLIAKHKIEIVGTPEIDILSFEPGKEIEYTANLAIFPSPAITGYDSLEVSVPKREVQNADVDQVLDGLRERASTLRRIEFRTTAQNGDVLDGMASITLEGEEATRPEPISIRLGDQTLPEEIEKGLVGLEVGETRELNTRIPEDHPSQAVRGKNAIYKITLNSLQERVLPELSDEFAEKAGMQVKTVLELRMKVREMLEAEFQREQEQAVHSEIIKELLKRNAFMVPQVVVDDQIRDMLVRAGAIDPKKVSPDRIPVEAFREKLGHSATERVRSTIIVDRIAQIENLQATGEEIEKMLAELAESAKVPLNEVKKYYREGSRMVGLALDISRNKVLKFLAERTKVSVASSDDQTA